MNKCNCKHKSCLDCYELMKKEIKQELKQEVIRELIPFFAQMFSGDEERFFDFIKKIQEENANVPEKWDGENVNEGEKLASDLQEVVKAREEVKNLKSKCSLVNDIPAINQQLREICYSEKSPDIVESAMRLSEVDTSAYKENFLKERIENLEEMNGKLIESNTELAHSNKELQGKMNNIENERYEVKKEIDAVKQYQRREIGQLHNIIWNAGEDIKKVVVDFLYNTMGLDIHPSDISTCHRVFTPKGSEWNGGSPLYDPASPPIYVKFIARDAKNYVMNNKSNLRGLRNANGYPYLINENLTPYRRGLFKKVKESLYNFRFVWTKEGTIMARKYRNSKVLKIYTYEDLDNITNNYFVH